MNRLRKLIKIFFEYKNRQLKDKNLGSDEPLYTGRLYLFDLIPLWEVHLTKREWEREIFFKSFINKRIVYEVEFLDYEDERKIDK